MINYKQQFFMRKILILFILILLTSSCSCSWLGSKGGSTDDTPLSIAAPIANLQGLFHSTSGTDGTTRITGLDGSVVALASVVAENTTTGASVTTTADSAGAFQLELSASVGDSVTLTVTASDTLSTTSFVIALTDPVPLDITQTDVAVSQNSNMAYVTATGSSTVSMVAIDLSTRQVISNTLFTDPDTGVNLTDLADIEIFDDQNLVLLLEKSQLKYYLVNLTGPTMLGSPISLTGNFATIVSQNNVRFRATLEGVTATEELMRETISRAISTFNSLITSLPDSGTSMMLEVFIGPTTTQLFVGGTFSGNGLLYNFNIQNSTLAINSTSSLTLPSATLSGMTIFADKTRALLGNQNTLSGLGSHRALYECDLTSMTRTNTLLVDGVPEEIVASPDGNAIYVTLSESHQLLQLNTSASTLAVDQEYSTGPNPSRVAIGSQSSLAAVLNDSDTTVSFITPSN